MKRLVLLSTACAVGLGWANETMFRVGFDKWSVKADSAKGSADAPQFKEGLMLRMFRGPADKGNAMLLSGDEKIIYQAKGNVSPRQGTISFWVAPVDWKATSEGTRDFVTVESPRFSITIGKHQEPTLFAVEFVWKDAPTVAKRAFPCVWLNEAAWKSGEWHRFDVVWNERGVTFFVDALKRPSHRIDGVVDTNCHAEFASPWKDLPVSLDEGTITLAGGGKEGSTAIDELEIRDYPMTEEELRAEYVKYYPLAADAPVIEKPRMPRLADRTPYRVKAGVDRTVPEPWTPIVRKGPKTFGVYLRDYAFGDGPFPVRIDALGENVLERAPELTFETAKGTGKVRWSDFEVADFAADRVTLAGKGEANGVVFGWTGQLWFDGAYRIELEGAPKETEVEVRKMNLMWSVPAKHSKYLLTNQGGRLGEVSVQWTNRYDRGFYTYRGESLLWLTGHRRGFLWWAESDANCVHRKGVKPVRLVRAPSGAAAVRVEYINEPATLAKTARWNFVFDATPTRTPRKDYRDWHMGTYCPTPHQDKLVVGWETFHNPLDDIDLTHCASHWPRAPERYHAAMQKYRATGNGRTWCYPYSWPGAICDNEAEWDVFLDEWKKVPSRIQVGTKDGKKWSLRQCCGHTGVADLMCYRFQRMMDLYYKDGMRGINYDICDPDWCENMAHGCGGVDAFGRSYYSSNVWHLREFLMRIYKIAHRYPDGGVINHAHNYFNPICHSFSDFWTPGEQYNQGVTDNPDWFYQDDIPAYDMECAYNPKIKGVPMIFHTMPPGYDLKYIKPGKFPAYARKAISRFLVHDINIYAGKGDPLVSDKWFAIIEKLNMNDAEFNGYWEDGMPKLTDDDRIEVGVYDWKKPSPLRKMIVAANRAHEPRKGLLVPPDVPADATFRDLWNGKDLTREAFLSFEIPAGEFAAIGISYGQDN